MKRDDGGKSQNGTRRIGEAGPDGKRLPRGRQPPGRVRLLQHCRQCRHLDPAENAIIFPDSFIICGSPTFDPRDTDRNSALNPRVIFEVLEATTEARDRGERFDAYRTLDSLRESVLVSQHEPRIETFQRRDKAGWTLSFWTGRDAAARLSSVAIDTPLAEVYAGIAFDEAAS